MADPQDLIWATDAGASKVEPPLAKKTAGWVAGEQPPASYFNWWQNLVYQCLTEQQTASQRSVMNALALALAGTVTTPNGAAATSAIAWNSSTGHWAVCLGDGNAYVSRLLTPASGGTTTPIAGITELYDDGDYIQAIGMTDRAIASSPNNLSTMSFTTRLATVRQYSAICANFRTPNVRVALANGWVARSTDGLAWTETAATGSLAGALKRVVIWDPVRLRFFMAASDGNAMVSTDGITWSNIGTHGLLGVNMMSAVYYAARDAIVVCAAKSSGGEVKQSTDGGVTWQAAGFLSVAAGVCEVFDIGGLAVGLRGHDKDLRMSADLATWPQVPLQGVTATPTSTVRGLYRFLYMPGNGVAQLAYPNNAGAITLTATVLP